MFERFLELWIERFLKLRFEIFLELRFKRFLIKFRFERFTTLLSNKKRTKRMQFDKCAVTNAM